MQLAALAGKLDSPPSAAIQASERLSDATMAFVNAAISSSHVAGTGLHLVETAGVP